MDSLPAELLEKIFGYLNWQDLELIEPTCQRWSAIIASRFFEPRLAAQSEPIRRALRAYGWERPGGKNEAALVKLLYGKVFHELPRRWRGEGGGGSGGGSGSGGSGGASGGVSVGPSLSPEVVLGEYE
jgi:hypothetical protein